MQQRIGKKEQRIKRHFKTADPILFSVLSEMELEVLQQEQNAAGYFSKLCREIISQQLGSKAAHAIHQRFLKLFPRQNPTVRRVLEYSEKEFRATGMSWAKARYLRDLAQKISDGDVRLSKLSILDDETVISELKKVKGIGRWTAEMFLIFTLGREDVFSFGDLGLRKGFERLYGKQRARTQKSIERIVRHWSPYRSYGSLALWHVLDGKK